MGSWKRIDEMMTISTIIFSDSDGDIEGNQNDPVGITNGNFDPRRESQN